MAKFETEAVKKMINDGGIFNSISVKKYDDHDKITCRKAFFYKHGKSAEDYKKRVEGILSAFLVENAKVIEVDEIWKTFCGGAPVGRQLHFKVVVSVTK